MMVWLLIPAYLVGTVMEDDDSVYDNNNLLDTSNLFPALIPDTIKHRIDRWTQIWSLGKWT